ncbi:MAG: DNA-binding protein [Lachnospiraceae bacterium]|nr:DNA-binding protein [Lachnospiraceae bacterium]
MENIVTQGFLYDFYGELLTEHQRSIYEEAVYNDLSLSEIAEAYGISRQGVHDLLKRCDHILANYEEKLHLVAKFMDAKEKIKEINQLAEEADRLSPEMCRLQIKKIQECTNHLMENF